MKPFEMRNTDLIPLSITFHQRNVNKAVTFRFASLRRKYTNINQKGNEVWLTRFKKSRSSLLSEHIGSPIQWFNHFQYTCKIVQVKPLMNALWIPTLSLLCHKPLDFYEPKGIGLYYCRAKIY